MNTKSESQTNRTVGRVAWLNAVLNTLLTLLKGVVGVSFGSRALVADAVHSAADVVGSVAVIVGLRIAQQPPDEDHPYGHGKAELISSAVVAGFLIAAGVDVAASSVKALFAPVTQPQVLSAVTAAIAIVVKEVLFQFNWRLGKRLGSRSLIASAYDHRSDVISSIAALVGILLSLLGRWQHIHWLYYMDAVAGLAVSLLILQIGYKVARDSLQPLMDRAVDIETMQTFHDAAMLVQGVAHIDSMRARDHGRYVIVDMEISVDANLTVAAGHDIAAQVKRDVVARIPQVSDVFVHVNPHYPNHRKGAPMHD